MKILRVSLILLSVTLAGMLGQGRAAAAEPACIQTLTRGCLVGGRFVVEVTWQDAQRQPALGQVIPLGTNAAGFWFFSKENPEFVVKILDGQSVNQFFWVFYAGLTSLRVTLKVTDTTNGHVKSYVSPGGTLASRADISAFPDSAGPSLEGERLPYIDRQAFPGFPGSSLSEPAQKTDFTVTFTDSPPDPRSGEQVTFTGNASIDPDHWCWTFGDETGPGCSADQKVAAHTYSAVGTYTVTLTVDRADGPVLDVTSVVQTISVGPRNCTFDVSLNPMTFGAAGGSGTVTLTASSEDCAWTAESQAAFLHLSTTSGSGSGTFILQVDPNDSGTTRTGNLSVAGQILTISQSGRSCTFAIDPTQVTLTRAGQASSVAVDASADCAWSASVASGSDFITLLSPASGTGPGVLRFQVAPNPGDASRTGELTIAGQTLEVEQLAVDFAVDFFFSPPSAATGSPVSFFATATEPPASWCWTFGDGTPESCTVQAQVTHTYLSAGTYTVKLKGLRNGGGSAETTQTITVSAIGGGCGGLSTRSILKGNAVISPAFQSFDSNGGSGSVLVTTGDCKWTAESESGFVNVTTASGGPGPGVVQYQVDANPGRTARTGVIRIAGRIFLVLQAGKPCVSLDPPNASVAAGGGTYQVDVNAPADCSWTAASNDEPFLHVASVSADHGSGTVTYRVDPNTTGAGRAGSLSIGGVTFPVAQETCTYSFVLGSAGPVSTAGGIRMVNVGTQPDCPWQATTSEPSVIGLAGTASGHGHGSFEYCMAANRQEARTGTIAIADGSVEISQRGFTSPLTGCRSTATSLCLFDRFEIQLAFRTPNAEGVGSSIRLNQRSGYFTFFDPTNPEILLKVIDGRPVNGRFWLFYGALSNVGYAVTVTDTVTGKMKLYCNPSGTFRSMGDTNAFPPP